MKIFLDANVIVDFLDKPSYDNNIAIEVLRILKEKKSNVFVSPTTFAITFYLFSERNKNLKNVNAVLKEFFRQFTFTTEDNVVMKKVFTSSFEDLEDALQYYSAKASGIDWIITKNKKDFINATGIVILHPLEFIDLHYSYN